MASPRFAWGIDVGNGALKAVCLTRENDQLRVTDFEYIEHEQVLSSAGDNRDALVASALANFVARHPIKGGVAAVSTSGQQSFARFIKLPPVEEKKIPEIVRFEAIQQIPFPLDDVEWSYQLFRDERSPDVEVGIFAMRKDLVSRHIKQFTDVELNVQVVQMNSLAVYNAMYHDNRFSGTTMIVDLGAENTDLIIADGETVWLRSIPIGGNAFTESLVKAFKLNFAKAEDLKRNAATSKYARQIFQAMRPVFADLVSEIQRSMGFYASIHRESQIQKIIAVGGTFKMPTLQKYLQQNLQLEVVRLDHLGAGAPAEPKLATAFNDHVLSMAGAYGLAIQAMGEGKIASSLLPTAIRRAKMWREKNKWFAAAAACFVAAPVLAYGAMWAMHDAPYEAAEKNRSEIKRIVSEARSLDSAWSEIEQSGSADRQEIINVQSLLNYRNFWPQVLADVYSSLPQPDWQSLDQLKATPRTQRQQIVVDSIETKYVADLDSLLSASDLDYSGHVRRLLGQDGRADASRGFGGAPMQNNPMADGQRQNQATAGEPKRGFLIAIRGTTPFSAGLELVSSTLVKKINGIGRDNKGARHYYIARAITLDSIKMADGQLKNKYLAAAQSQAALKDGTNLGLDSTRRSGGFNAGAFGGGLQPGMTGMPGMPAGMPPGMLPEMERFGAQGGNRPGGNQPFTLGSTNAGGRTTQANQIQDIVDPITGESMNNDTEFRVVFLVVVDRSTSPTGSSAQADQPVP